MDNLVKNEVEKVVSMMSADLVVVEDFRNRLAKNNLTRDENPLDHFCSFIVPFDKKSQKVFLGHHIKANDWIPPGGHIEINETPMQAAVREAKEELGISIDDNQLELFTLDYLDVSAPHKICKVHWHIWYLFYTHETNYKFDTGEFHDAGWFSFPEALQKTTQVKYRNIISKLQSF